MRVTSVRSGDWEALRTLRLRALASDPDAFGDTVAAAAARPAESWRERTLASEVGTVSRWFLAVDDVGGWVGMARAQAEADGAHLHGMWVAPKARGSGAAGLLCDACAAWAAERGFGYLSLDVFRANARAIAAHRRCGFTVTAEGTEEPGGEPLLAMVRPTL